MGGSLARQDRLYAWRRGAQLGRESQVELLTFLHTLMISLEGRQFIRARL